MAEVNWLAVLVAGLIPMVIGALWYGPLFGKKWMQMIGKTEAEIRASANPLKMYGGTLLASLVLAFVLAFVLEAFRNAYGTEGLSAGLQGGFWVWLGFVLTIGWQEVAFEDKKPAVYLLNMAYNLVCLLAMGVLLATWR